MPKNPVGVRNSDHALDLRIAASGEEEPVTLRKLGKRVSAIPIRLPWLPNCPSAEPVGVRTRIKSLTCGFARPCPEVPAPL
jgi:hypothetical protein